MTTATEPRLCTIEGCAKPFRARGYCVMHWKRWRKYGDPRREPNVTTTCTIEGCDAAHMARGWCNTHYFRWRRHGDPLHVEVTVGDDLARFMDRVDVGHPLGCWVWTGRISTTGYAGFSVNRISTYGHRWAVEHLKGQPIPEGMHVDHLCRNTACVNPDHLEVVTARENIRRGVTPWARAERERHRKGTGEVDENDSDPWPADPKERDL